MECVELTGTAARIENTLIPEMSRKRMNSPIFVLPTGNALEMIKKAED
jgi:hypothetical protein